MRRAIVAVVVLVVMSATALPGCERAAIAAGVSSRSVEATNSDALTVRTVTGSVARWKDEALAAGWKASQWPRLRCLIARESRGDPNAHNGRDSHGGSRGLLQINGVWHAWLTARGIIRHPSDLYRPIVNLRAGRAIWRAQGWAAWRATVRRCP